MNAESTSTKRPMEFSDPPLTANYFGVWVWTKIVKKESDPKVEPLTLAHDKRVVIRSFSLAHTDSSGIVHRGEIPAGDEKSRLNLHVDKIFPENSEGEKAQNEFNQKFDVFSIALPPTETDLGAKEWLKSQAGSVWLGEPGRLFGAFLVYRVFSIEGLVTTLKSGDW